MNLVGSVTAFIVVLASLAIVIVLFTKLEAQIGVEFRNQLRLRMNLTLMKGLGLGLGLMTELVDTFLRIVVLQAHEFDIVNHAIWIFEHVTYSRSVRGNKLTESIFIPRMDVMLWWGNETRSKEDVILFILEIAFLTPDVVEILGDHIFAILLAHVEE